MHALTFEELLRNRDSLPFNLSLLDISMLGWSVFSEDDAESEEEDDEDGCWEVGLGMWTSPTVPSTYMGIAELHAELATVSQ